MSNRTSDSSLFFLLKLFQFYSINMLIKAVGDGPAGQAMADQNSPYPNQIE